MTRITYSMNKNFNETVKLKTIITNVEMLRMSKKKAPTKDEDAHIKKVLSMGCIVCVNLEYGETPAVPHHIGNGATGMKATNYEVIPLCPEHHTQGGYGVAVHQGRVQWETNFGTEKELLEQTLEWLDL